jgi:phage shock protein PspC (stress-responsive transcriptional regulator)
VQGGCAGYAARFGAEVHQIQVKMLLTHARTHTHTHTHTYTHAGTHAPTHITYNPEIILLRRRIASIAHRFGACVAVHTQTHSHKHARPHTHTPVIILLCVAFFAHVLLGSHSSRHAAVPTDKLERAICLECHLVHVLCAYVYVLLCMHDAR